MSVRLCGVALFSSALVDAVQKEVYVVVLRLSLCRIGEKFVDNQPRREKG